ncbi:glycosyltransferase family 4 protein [Ktedonobacteria bacterium brp13]|nr:glycosyltransferase family 4 protein [Ktedonobacteria bacterium brp13]
MERKPRIAVVISTFIPNVGGAETQTLAQCQRLIEAGHRVRVFTFHHKHHWLPYEIIQGVPTKRIAGRLLSRRQNLPRRVQQFLYLLAIIQLTWTIWRERNNFDVLQVIQCSSLALPLAFVCWLAHKPMTIVLISAGADKATKTGEAIRLLSGTLDPTMPWLEVNNTFWIDGDLYGLQAAGPLVVNITRTLLKKIGAVMIVLSTRMYRYMKINDFEIPGTRLIPNGVDVERFYPVPLTPEDVYTRKAKTVVCVSKARYEKGLDVLIHAWHIVQQSVPDARLIIVGNGPVFEQLQKMAQLLGIYESIEFAGLQSDVPAQLHRGVIDVLPSRWEGMPNALLEAMACGLACVATCVSGSEDLIQSGENGLLVPTNDYEAMAQALLTLLNDPALVERYGAAARATIEEHYTLDHVLHMYTDVYQDLLSWPTDRDPGATALATSPGSHI